MEGSFPSAPAPSTSFKAKFTSATYTVPSASVDAITACWLTPFESIASLLTSAATSVSPKLLLSMANTCALGVAKNLNAPEPSFCSSRFPCATAWITACCVGPSESAPLE